MSSLDGVTVKRLHKAPAEKEYDPKKPWKIVASLLFLECQIAGMVNKTLSEWFLETPKWSRIAAVAIWQEEQSIERWYKILNG